MGSSVFHNPINHPIAILSRTQNYPSLVNFSSEFCHSKSFHRNQAYGCVKKLNKVKASTIAEAPSAQNDEKGKVLEKKLRVLVAGGGIGGLVFALAAKRRGFDVVVFERDLSAIRGEGQYRGPIQIQSNALAALEAIDMDVAEKVMAAGCITGDRINGLVDGVSGNW